jgi:hypothetical protein
MDLTVVTYVAYLLIALPLTAWVARALHRYGQVFLIDVFNGDVDLAHAVNQLLVIGFYLLNFGYVAFFMTTTGNVANSRRLLEVLSTKIGGVAVVLGLVHFANLWAFNAFRRRAVLRAKAIPPIEPTAHTPIATAGGPGWAVPGSPAQ